MITIISATNRENSKTLEFAKHIHSLMMMQKQECDLLAMDELPLDMFHKAMYNGAAGQSEAFKAVQDRFVIPATKFYIVSPEYNGSYPGVLKLFLDACSIRDAGPSFTGKKVGLLGIGAGRAGNLRGMEHLTGVLNHLGMVVMPNRLPVSNIGGLIDENGVIHDEGTQKVLEDHVHSFIQF